VSGEVLALLAAIGVPLFLRLLDYLLPKGRHLKIIHRWTVDDDDETGE